MGTTERLAKYAVDTSYRDFPKEAVTIAKDLILDCLGDMLGGSRDPVCQISIRYVKESGGVPECGVIGGGFRTSLTNAAFVNGSAAHGLELEAVGKFSGSNICTIIPAALSVGEKFNLSGKAVLEGVILGFEVHGKIGLGAPGGADRGFCSIPLLGPIGAAATASKMMGLDSKQMRMAYGMAISQSGGLYRQTGSMSHLLESGFACRNGVTAALLAKEGMTSDPDLIEGLGGFAEIFCTGAGGYNLEEMTKNLGDPFYIVKPGTNVKKYGACFFNHPALEALFQLIQEHDIRYDDVNSVQADIPAFFPRLLRFSDPQDGEQAKFSLQHALGAAIVDGKPELPYLRPFTDAGAVDPRYKEARKKINPVIREDSEYGRRIKGTPVTVKLKNGKSFSKTVEVFKGSPEMPLSKDELRARYENCARGVLSSQQVQRSIELVLNLENLDSILELMEFVTFGTAHKKNG
jgi:2-methylcitrate dehydratase PrpD